MSKFKLLMHIFPNYTTFYVHLREFQITHWGKQCTSTPARLPTRVVTYHGFNCSGQVIYAMKMLENIASLFSHLSVNLSMNIFIYLSILKYFHYLSSICVCLEWRCPRLIIAQIFRFVCINIESYACGCLFQTMQ